MPESGGYASHPTWEKPPTNSESITSMAPKAVIQKPRLLRNGKAVPRAPICSGTR